MPRTLSLRTLLIVGLLLYAALSIITTVVLVQQSRVGELYNHAQEDAINGLAQYSPTLEAWLETDPQRVIAVFAQMRGHRNVAAVGLLDPDGRLFLESPAGRWRGDASLAADLQNAQNHAEAVVRKLPGIHRMRVMLRYAAPHPGHAPLHYGGLFVELDLADAVVSVKKQALISQTPNILGAILIAVLIAIILKHRVVAPLTELETLARRLGDGELGVRSPELPTQELAVIGHAFNAMAERLQESQRNLAHEALGARRLAEERDAVLSTLPDLLFEIDAQGCYLRIWAQHREKLLSASAEHLIGQSLEAALPPAAAHITYQAVQEALRTGESRGSVVFIPLADGEHWFELAATRRDRSPEAPTSLVLARDITEQISDRRLRSEGEQKLAALLRTTVDGFLELDENGYIVEANAIYLNRSGYTRDELIGRHLAFLNAESDLEATEAHLQQVLREGFDRYTTLHRRKDGGLWDAEISISHLNYAGRGGFIAFQRDITELRKAHTALEVSEQRLRLTLGAANIGLYDLNTQTGEAWVSPEYATMLGYDPDTFEETNSNWISRLHPEEQAHVAEVYQAYVRGTLPEYRVEFRQKTRNGNWKWLLSIGAIVARDEAGDPLRMLGIHIDLDERKRAESTLQLMAQVYSDSHQGIVITDAGCNIIMANRAFSEITGYSESDIQGKNPRVLQSGQHGPEFFSAMWTAINQTGRWFGEIWNKRKDGTIFPEWLTVSRVCDARGRVIHYIGMFNDISVYKEQERHIRQLAHYDALTALPNRQLFGERVQQSLAAAKQANESLALLFLDLDHFKHINDTLGHRLGDRMLTELARRLQANLREQDTVSRQGGDEFIILLPATDRRGAALVAEKIVDVAVQPYRIDQYELRVTASVGIALYPADGTDFETLYRCADTAMYGAKDDGRNGYRFFTPEMQQRSSRSLRLESSLRQALENQELSLCYQPQIAAATGVVTGVEALLRWDHPELGAMTPTEFIPIAENTGLILPIGEWVIRTAATQMLAWLRAGIPLQTVAINLSAVQFKQSNLIERIAEILAEVGIEPGRIELELTESVMTDDPLAAMQLMDRLHASGIRLSIDDFGTGYSSLSYLKRFQIDKLKIDQTFVRDLAVDKDDAIIVQAIISLAHALEYTTVAEGVETEIQREFLLRNHCDVLQGHLFSHPLPAGEMTAWLMAYAALDRPG